jgi:hypothetical protein
MTAAEALLTASRDINPKAKRKVRICRELHERTWSRFFAITSSIKPHHQFADRVKGCELKLALFDALPSGSGVHLPAAGSAKCNCSDAKEQQRTRLRKDKIDAEASTLRRKTAKV